MYDIERTSCGPLDFMLVEYIGSILCMQIFLSSFFSSSSFFLWYEEDFQGWFKLIPLWSTKTEHYVRPYLDIYCTKFQNKNSVFFSLRDSCMHEWTKISVYIYIIGENLGSVLMLV